MSRQAVYHKDDTRYRVVSLPGGQWQFQRHDGTRGYDHGSNGPQVPQDVAQAAKASGVRIPHNDPWKPLRRATDWVTAKVQLDTLVAPKEAVTA
jgi:hypothetical protein